MVGAAAAAAVVVAKMIHGNGRPGQSLWNGIRGIVICHGTGVRIHRVIEFIDEIFGKDFVQIKVVLCGGCGGGGCCSWRRKYVWFIYFFHPFHIRIGGQGYIPMMMRTNVKRKIITTKKKKWNQWRNMRAQWARESDFCGQVPEAQMRKALFLLFLVFPSCCLCCLCIYIFWNKEPSSSSSSSTSTT